MAWRGEGSRGDAEGRRGEEGREEGSEGERFAEGETDGAAASRLGVLVDGAEGVAWGEEGSRRGADGERRRGSREESEVGRDTEIGAGGAKGMAWRGGDSRGGAEGRREEEEREEGSEGMAEGGAASRIGVLGDGGTRTGWMWGKDGRRGRMVSTRGGRRAEARGMVSGFDGMRRTTRVSAWAVRTRVEASRRVGGSGMGISWCSRAPGGRVPRRVKRMSASWVAVRERSAGGGMAMGAGGGSGWAGNGIAWGAEG